jgi:sialate O-acetylesterase
MVQRMGSGLEFDAPLVLYHSKEPAAFELCDSTEKSCRFVHAELGEGGDVWLAVEDGTDPNRVRYCRADSPLCNLYDVAGLPVGPFEIEVRQ